MHELRIAVGLVACTVAWLAIAPAAPTLVSFSAPEPRIASNDTPATAPIATDGDPFDPSSGSSDTSQAARTIGTPPPIASVGDPPPTRVAAVPPTVEPKGDAAPKLQLFSRPVAVDAGTLKAGRTTLRVADIEPISPDARCTDGAQSWPCGIRARTAFRSWLRGRSVLCSVPAGREDAADLTVSCLAGETDIGEWLVANGWAAPASASRYTALGETAKTERRGIYAYGVTP